MNIELLADHPSLIAALAELRRREWGHPPEHDGTEDWIEITSREAGRSELPVTWVAIDENGSAVGAVALDRHDIEERRDRTLWVVGTIVAGSRRGNGIGTRLMGALEEWVKTNGHDELWGATGGRAMVLRRAEERDTAGRSFVLDRAQQERRDDPSLGQRQDDGQDQQRGCARERIRPAR